MQFLLQKVVRVIATESTSEKLEEGREMRMLEPSTGAEGKIRRNKIQ